LFLPQKEFSCFIYSNIYTLLKHFELQCDVGLSLVLVVLSVLSENIHDIHTFIHSYITFTCDINIFIIHTLLHHIHISVSFVLSTNRVGMGVDSLQLECQLRQKSVHFFFQKFPTRLLSCGRWLFQFSYNKRKIPVEFILQMDTKSCFAVSLQFVPGLDINTHQQVAIS
jgi:hypothetical protein